MLSKVQIKTIHALQHKKYRQKSGRFIAEGRKITKELLQSNEIQIERLYVLPSCKAEWTGFDQVAVPIIEITERELKKISFLSSPQEVVALCKIPQSPLPAKLKGRATLMLDAIRDPGNLGTIIRIADWFGIGQLACSSDCVDPFNPKTVQASMGSLGRVKIWTGELEGLLSKNPEVTVYATTFDGKAITQFQPLKEGVIIIGNESHGISKRLLEVADEYLTIPRLGGAESLNAAIATGIICGRLLL